MDYDAGIRVTYCMWFINLDAQPSHPSRVDVQWSPTPTTNAARCQTVSTPLPWCHTAPAVLSMVRIYLPHRDPPAVEPEVRKICVTPNLLIFLESPPNFPFGQTCWETSWIIQFKKPQLIYLLIFTLMKRHPSFNEWNLRVLFSVVLIGYL